MITVHKFPLQLMAVPWLDLWGALKLLLMIVGAGALCGWFAQPVPWWIVVPEAVLLVVAFCVCFLFVTSWRERQRRRASQVAGIDVDRRIARIRRRRGFHGSVERTIANREPQMRRRFVRVDPDTGDEIYAWDPVTSGN